LYWSAVINGFVSAPVMAMMMLIVSSKKIMKKFAVRGLLWYGGWVATAAMGAAAFGLIVSAVLNTGQ
jgi:Mn2+/Fe2+ NRAMP family transporter